MKHYTDYKTECIGYSDIAKLVLVGCGEDGAECKMMKFYEDDMYFAHIVDEDAIVEDSQLVCEFNGWMKIYDDEGLSYEVYDANKVKVYRFGYCGCIIQIL